MENEDRFDLNTSTHYLKSINFCLARIIETHAQFIFCNAKYEQLIQHGYLIGHFADASKQIQTRLYELFTPPACLAGSIQINTMLSHLFLNINFSSSDDSKLFLDKLSSFLYQLSNQIKHVQDCKIDSLADLPMKTTLSCVLVYLNCAIDILNKNLNDKYLYDLNPLVIEHELNQKIENIYIPELPLEPHKPNNLRYSEDKIFEFESLDELCQNKKIAQAFYHFVLVDVEITAMQVCAHLILLNRKVNLKFRNSMARQIYDEARHAVIIKNILNELGGDIGDYSYSHLIWKRVAMTSNLKEQLAIQQIIQEGNALQDNFALIGALKKNNQFTVQKLLEFINADESQHVYIGNYWLNYLSQKDGTDPNTIKQKASKLIGMNIKATDTLSDIVLDTAGFYLTAKK